MAPRVQAVRLGGFVVSVPLTQFSQNASGIFAVPYITGTIGGQMLRRFAVIFEPPAGTDDSRTKRVLRRPIPSKKRTCTNHLQQLTEAPGSPRPTCGLPSRVKFHPHRILGNLSVIPDSHFMQAFTFVCGFEVLFEDQEANSNEGSNQASSCR
jgi:hypothetical protein